MPTTPQPSKEDIKIAKRIIGKWGYEEEGWWMPIAKSLAAAKQEVAEGCLDAIRELMPVGSYTTADMLAIHRRYCDALLTFFRGQGIKCE